MNYFTSDTHIDHDRVLIGTRGAAFPTIESWQEHILEEMTRCLNGGNRLFILGDFALSDISKWRCRLKGDVWLIVGNHDPSMSRCVKAFGKDKVRHVFMAKVCGNPCWLSHYAHAFWPSSHRGSYHLYGHTHDQRETTLDGWMPQRRSMDVSPETAFRLFGQWGPMSEDQIESLLGSKSGHDDVEWYANQRGKYE